MVTSLISGLTQGFQEVVFPVWTPQPSPTSPRRFLPTANREKRFFMEFSCWDEPLGRVVIKVVEGAGQSGKEFESLVTEQDGFGYKGSRVYACCKDEWCLLGDLLYQDPPPSKRNNTDWDPRVPEGCMEEDKGGGGRPSVRQLYRRCYRGTQTLMDTKQLDTRGAVVAVASDYDLDTRNWTLGPQIKICLSDSLLRSGHVLGFLTEGMDVAQRLSRMGSRSYEPEARITISNCGAL